MRKDNKGMTLIELLVAITILAIVVSPFLNTFFMAAKQNNKSREILRATTVAQNLMEGLKAFSLEDICTQINQKESGVDSKLYLPKGYEKQRELPVLTEENREEKSGNGLTGEDYVFQSTSCNRYQFALGGLEEDGKKYDARITLDASGNENLKEKNDFFVSKMKESTDAIFSVDQQEETQLFQEVGWQEEDWAKITRTFTIFVEEAEEKTKVEIRVLYDHATDGEREGKTLTKTLEEVKNVYVMYYPNYHSERVVIKDRFEVDYRSSQKVNLYLVKQKYQEDKPDNHYVASLKVMDENTDKEPRIFLRTNILENLYTGASPTLATAMTYEYTCGGSSIGNEIEAFGEMLGFIEGRPQTLIGQTDDRNAIYKTKVQIYPAGTYPDGYDSEEPIAVLEN